jgi:predicted HicB family RNase H-like nuclease
MPRQKLGARLPQVRVTPALKAALENKAHHRNIRLNDAIRQAIEEYVQRNGNQEKEK